MTESHLAAIGGRSGVGKSSVAFALHDLLVARDFRHAVLEGDALDLAHPAPWQHQLAERNLAAVWANYRALGYRHLIYTNTVAVLQTQSLADAMGDSPAVTAILLDAADETTAERLGRREHGESLSAHLERSARAARLLDQNASSEVHRVRTDGLVPREIACIVLSLLNWTGAETKPPTP